MGRDPDRDYYGEEHLWRKDFWAFFWAICRHWLWWLSATIGSGLCTALLRILGGQQAIMPMWVVIACILSGLVVASFQAFRVQMRAAESKEAQLAKEQHNHAIDRDDSQRRLKDLEIQITALNSKLDDRERRKQIRGRLSAFLSKLEARYREIRQMLPSRYVESIGDDLGTEAITMTRYDYTNYVRKLNDKTSFEILREIYEYLEGVEQGKGALFISFTGIERSPSADGETIEGVQFNKHSEILDHLQHRQKNLLAMIKAME